MDNARRILMCWSCDDDDDEKRRAKSFTLHVFFLTQFLFHFTRLIMVCQLKFLYIITAKNTKKKSIEKKFAKSVHNKH